MTVREPGGIALFIAAFACLIGMQLAVRRSLPVTVGLPGAFGLLIRLAVAPTVAYYGSADLRAVGGGRRRPRCASPGSASGGDLVRIEDPGSGQV